MAHWGEGYVTDITYTHGYYRELAPVWLHTAATLLGFRAPDIAKPYAYAELGCGQGFGTALLAAANPWGRFWGFDFNPAQIAHANRLAGAAGLGNVEFHEASFQQLAAAADGAWPAFDFITLHGIYSWVNRDNQRAILEFIRRFLKPGGLVFISYNCTPGWTSMAPLQRLMRHHADAHPARSDLQGQAALDFVRQLREGGACYFNAHADLAGRLDTAAKLDSHYISHEYLNREWKALDFAETAADCAQAKLGYLGSATLAENLENLSAPPALLPLLAAQADPVMRQTLLDFAANKGFRRDIYQKGPLALTPQEHLDAVRHLRLSPLHIPAAGPYSFKTPLGEANGHAELYGPLLQALAGGTMTMEEIGRLPALAGKGLTDWIEVALLLINGGYAHPQAAAAEGSAGQRFNRAVCEAMLDGHAYSFLAAPGLGGGVSANFMDMLATRLLLDAPWQEQAVFVDAALRLLAQKGQSLTRDGAMLEAQAATLELQAFHAEFQAHKAHLWRRLGILPPGP